MLLNLSLMYALIVVVEFNLIKGSFFQFLIVLHAMFVSSLFHFVMIFSIVSSSLEWIMSQVGKVKGHVRYEAFKGPIRFF